MCLGGQQAVTSRTPTTMKSPGETPLAKEEHLSLVHFVKAWAVDLLTICQRLRKANLRPTPSRHHRLARHLRMARPHPLPDPLGPRVPPVFSLAVVRAFDKQDGKGSKKCATSQLLYSMRQRSTVPRQTKHTTNAWDFLSSLSAHSDGIANLEK
jgi:hypothetical protein